VLVPPEVRQIRRGGTGNARAALPAAYRADEAKTDSGRRSSGNAFSVTSTSFPARYQSLPPPGAAVNTLKFGDPRNQRDAAGRPDKLLVTFRRSGGKAALHGFRIRLAE
jgi:hypothetical protein